jgi:Uma2 family endonuclease
MVQSPPQNLTLVEFLALPEGDTAYELVDGQAIPKVSPKFFHSTTQKKLLFLLDPWSQGRGRVESEWAVTLKRDGKDWVPVPDLLYISYDRLAADWMADEACPVPPDLVIEIISPGQTFGEMTEKATDYLTAGVSRVWIVDSRSRSLTAFLPDSLPRTYRGDVSVVDSLLPDLKLTAQQIFPQPGLPG